MKTPWTDLGLRFAAPGSGLLRTHAMLPTPIVLADRVRVYFSSCDADLRGRIFSVDLSLDHPHPVIHFDPAPVLDLGAAGCFDADGVNPCHLERVDDIWRLYYVGWQRLSEDVPYTLLAGLAVSEDRGKTFRRWKTEPVLPATPDEGYFRTAPFVRRVGEGFQILYIGGNRFVRSPSGKMLPRYAIRRSRSADGINWAAPAEDVLLPDEARGEIGFGRPRVETLPGQDPVLMVSVRTEQSYRLMMCPWDEGLVDPSRLVPVIDTAGQAWASEMTCFGATCQVGERTLLFYNGNGFGRTGFGLAYRDPAAAEDGFRRM
ncbi:hypothetical protein [Methylobacterium sp. 13MFTsu3.1M2]|uniref:hypothetical protein n=1 Tax=Methylobacterium sp. 13MFTsu3.1M2 TaxID=1502776 RepID=UPI0008F2694E|nr:hypothetical protein [Methylobacterium sp. 13MFTsu3.1M2]SFF18526.1 hypothetical protein SAMN02799627_05625 [Methylobacterium sp. 13MFTsu3.1M2]